VVKEDDEGMSYKIDWVMWLQTQRRFSQRRIYAEFCIRRSLLSFMKSTSLVQKQLRRSRRRKMRLADGSVE